jgi:hypothetical protein
VEFVNDIHDFNVILIKTKPDVTFMNEISRPSLPDLAVSSLLLYTPCHHRRPSLGGLEVHLDFLRRGRSAAPPQSREPDDIDARGRNNTGTPGTDQGA